MLESSQRHTLFSCPSFPQDIFIALILFTVSSILRPCKHCEDYMNSTTASAYKLLETVIIKLALKRSNQSSLDHILNLSKLPQPNPLQGMLNHADHPIEDLV